jgi:RelA/SpoT family (p)ppGpp synthetase
MHFFGPTYHPELPRKKQNIDVNPFLNSLSSFNNDDVNLIKKAFYFADRVHLGQYRQSGEPYITHPLAVAEICNSWKLGKFAICAALLHDVMEDQGITKNELIADFGIHIADLVEGLTKLTHIEFNSKEDERAANFERLLSSSVKDHKVLLVKIADRLHNMRTLGYMLPNKQKVIAKETQEIYAPFARLLGLHDAYNELQDLSFLYYSPWRYNIIKNAMQSQIMFANSFIEEICNGINDNLARNNIFGECKGHIKTPYIIYSKLKKRKQYHGNARFRDIQDLLSFEIIAGNKLDCYTILGVLHSMFKPKPGKFKDYIALPKSNGYSGLHTSLIDSSGRIINMQIRTKRMQKIAQSGVTAFFEDDEIEDYENLENEAVDNYIHDSTPHYLLNALKELRSKTSNFKELLYYSKIDLSSDEIVVFDEGGNPVLIPRHSTALDFAYHVSYTIGSTTQYIEVNGLRSKLNHILRNGDLIKIKTNPNIKPKAEWLKIVKTSRAKMAIQHFLKLHASSINNHQEI